MLSFGHILVMTALHGTLTSMKLQITHYKCITFCLKQDKRHHITSKEFESIHWLPVYKTVHQCINAIISKFVNNVCPHYLNGVYVYPPRWRIELRSNFTNLKVPFHKTNICWKAFHTLVPFYRAIYPDLWKKPMF